jgi:hypothetical protein
MPKGQEVFHAEESHYGEHALVYGLGEEIARVVEALQAGPWWIRAHSKIRRGQ